MKKKIENLRLGVSDVALIWGDDHLVSRENKNCVAFDHLVKILFGNEKLAKLFARFPLTNVAVFRSKKFFDFVKDELNRIGKIK